MDGQQFDHLVRTLAHSRRALISLGAALGLLPFLADGRKRSRAPDARHDGTHATANAEVV